MNRFRKAGLVRGLVKVKVKLSLCFNWTPRPKGILGEWKYSVTHSLTLVLDRGEWSASRPSRFTLKERDPVTPWIGGWVVPRAVLDALMKRKIPSPRRESKPRTLVCNINSCQMNFKVTVKFPMWLSTTTLRRVSCLIKHYAIKTCWGNGVIAPRILNLGRRWRWVISFTPMSLYPQDKESSIPIRLGAGWASELV
jgi:hypothetical protein